MICKYNINGSIGKYTIGLADDSTFSWFFKSKRFEYRYGTSREITFLKFFIRWQEPQTKEQKENWNKDFYDDDDN